jgi:hypothetical protein
MGRRIIVSLGSGGKSAAIAERAQAGGARAGLAPVCLAKSPEAPYLQPFSASVGAVLLTAKVTRR